MTWRARESVLIEYLMSRALFGWFAKPLGEALLVALLAGGVYGVSRLTVDPRRSAHNASLAGELGRIEARNDRLRAEITDLTGEIGRLRGDRSESLYHARTRLGMLRPGEVLYQLPSGSPGRTARGDTGK